MHGINRHWPDASGIPLKSEAVFPVSMLDGSRRTQTLLADAERNSWDNTWRSSTRGRDNDTRSLWDVKRQLESLEERMASAVAYLNRQLLDHASKNSLPMSSSLDARLLALEQQQAQSEHRLAQLYDDSKVLGREQHVQEQRLQALQERATNAELASQRVAGLFQDLRRDVTDLFSLKEEEGGRLSPRSLGGEELRSLVAEQRMSQLEVAVWSLQSMELPELRVAVHAQERRLLNLESQPDDPDAVLPLPADASVEGADATRAATGVSDDGEHMEDLRAAEQRVSELEVALWSLQSVEIPELRVTLHSQDRRLVSLESRQDAFDAVVQVTPYPNEAVEEPAQDGAVDAGSSLPMDGPVHERNEGASNAGEEAAGGHPSVRRGPATISRSGTGAEDGGGPVTLRETRGAGSFSGLSGPETSAGFPGNRSADGPRQGSHMTTSDLTAAFGVSSPIGGDGDAGSGEAFEWPSMAWPSVSDWPNADGAAGSASFASASGDGAAGGTAGAAGSASASGTGNAETRGEGLLRRSSGGGDGAAGGREPESHPQSLGGDGAAGGGRTRESDFSSRAAGVGPEVSDGRTPDEADRAAAPATASSQGPSRRSPEQVEDAQNLSPDSASQDFEESVSQPQSLDDALLSLVSLAGSGRCARYDSEEEPLDISEAHCASRSSSDLRGSAHREEPESGKQRAGH